MNSNLPTAGLIYWIWAFIHTAWELSFIVSLIKNNRAVHGGDNHAFSILTGVYFFPTGFSHFISFTMHTHLKLYMHIYSLYLVIFIDYTVYNAHKHNVDFICTVDKLKKLVQLSRIQLRASDYFNDLNFTITLWLWIVFFPPNIYTVCPPKSGTLDFRYFDIEKYSIFWSDKTLSSKNNDFKIIWFGSVVGLLILQQFLETQSFTNFFKSVQAIYGGYSSPFLCMNHWASGQQCMEVKKSHNSWPKCHKNEEKIEWLCFWEMTTESNLLNQFHWSWYHSFQKTMFYLMK